MEKVIPSKWDLFMYKLVIIYMLKSKVPSGMHVMAFITMLWGLQLFMPFPLKFPPSLSQELRRVQTQCLPSDWSVGLAKWWEHSISGLALSLSQPVSHKQPLLPESRLRKKRKEEKKDGTNKRKRKTETDLIVFRCRNWEADTGQRPEYGSSVWRKNGQKFLESRMRM